MTASDELKPCPLCGREVYGKACGAGSFFSDEYEYEIECSCGLMFDYGPCRTPEEAEAEAVKLWNTRAYDSDSKTKRGAGMKSTDELRKYAERCHPGTFHLLKVIADRIDAEVEENYMRLPTGADGKPIHVGDTVEWAFRKAKPIEVNGVSQTSLFYSDDGVSMQWTEASNKRQVGEDA